MIGPIQFLRNVAYYIAFYLGSVFFVLNAFAVLLLGSRRQFRRAVEAWSAWHRGCVVHLLGIEVTIEGRPPEGTVLFAIKHESFFEAIDLPTLLDQPVIFAKDALARIPLWSLVGQRYGLVWVRREEGAKALRGMITAAREMTAGGRPLAIFPEGTRVRHGQCPPLQSGFAGLYKLLGVPVIPVAVDSGPVFRRQLKPRGRITIRFGEPIPPGLPRDEIEERVRAAINVLNTGD